MNNIINIKSHFKPSVNSKNHENSVKTPQSVPTDSAVSLRHYIAPSEIPVFPGALGSHFLGKRRGGSTPTVGNVRSHVEAEESHISVLHDVILAFGADKSPLSRSSH